MLQGRQSCWLANDSEPFGDRVYAGHARSTYPPGGVLYVSPPPPRGREVERGVRTRQLIPWDLSYPSPPCALTRKCLHSCLTPLPWPDLQLWQYPQRHPLPFEQLLATASKETRKQGAPMNQYQDPCHVYCLHWHNTLSSETSEPGQMGRTPDARLV